MKRQSPAPAAQHAAHIEKPCTQVPRRHFVFGGRDLADTLALVHDHRAGVVETHDARGLERYVFRGAPDCDGAALPLIESGPAVRCQDLVVAGEAPPTGISAVIK